MTRSNVQRLRDAVYDSNDLERAEEDERRERGIAAVCEPHLQIGETRPGTVEDFDPGAGYFWICDECAAKDPL